MNSHERVLTVALAGNPSSGKSTIFKQLLRATGAHAEGGEATITYQDRTIRLVDLPGAYSLSARNPNELLCREFIINHHPDVILNVLDADHLERNLFLTTQIIEMDVPRVYALNMVDEAREHGAKFDLHAFSHLLGGEVIETVGPKGEGIEELLGALLLAGRQNGHYSPVAIAYDEHVEAAIDRVQRGMAELHPEMPARSSRWLAMKLLEGDDKVLQVEGDHTALIAFAHEEAAKLTKQHGDEVPVLLANGRYGFIHGVVREVRELSGLDASRPMRDISSVLDNWLLHRIFGLPLFLLFLWSMFQSTFLLGQYPADAIDSGVAWVADTVQAAMPEGLIRDMLVDGIIGGVGGVVVFVPNIAILFLFISVFETSGYMARAAFLMDRVMHGIGLHGKAFIPLLVGFGCNVPAIMATRTIENRRDRIITILVNPFMSCSARLPVYVLLAGVFFKETAGTVVFAVHIIGIVVAMTAALLLRNTLFRGQTDPFVMELPPYRLPSLRTVLTHMWESAHEFLKKIGGVVLVGSILIWFLQAFPRDVELSVDYAAQETAILHQSAGPERDEALTELAHAKAAEYQEKRFLGQIGATVAPIFEPLGFDWKATIALITGIFAKEIVVSTFGVLYNVGEEVDAESNSLRSALAGAMQPVVAFGFMVFILLYIPCLATFAAIRREAGSWGWATFSVFFSLAVGWLTAFLVIQIGWLLV